MKIINYGNHYEIYSDDLKTFDKLPSATYKVLFNPMAGFSLIKVDDFKSNGEKIYGSHKEKIEKVIKTYREFNRSLGVILSGNKGMGKSMFVQLAAEEVTKMGLPVIMVTKAYPGIADFIDKIDQEALIVFDEFEKMFDENKEGVESQDNLLGLFDGTSQKKRMYAITVNNLNKVNEFILSRPGRFHYHIRFDYPNAEEIEVYLKDKLDEKYYGEIKHVVAFASKVKVNYDSLRAIAFELNQGYTFKSSIGDLNILMTDTQRYDIKIDFTNGKSYEMKNQSLNMFEERIRINQWIDGDEWVSINFNTSDIISEVGKMTVQGSAVDLSTGSDNEIFTKDVEVSSITISHHIDSGVNYRLDY